MNLRLTLALLLAAILGVSAAPEERPALPKPDAPPPATFAVECLMVRVPIKAALTLVPQLSDETKAVAAVAKVQQMIAGGEATLVADLVGRGLENRAIRAESFEEVRYASEYDDIVLPAARPLSARSPEVLKSWPYVGVPPGSFETRHTGHSLEAKVQRTMDPQVFACRFSLEHGRLERFQRFIVGTLPGGEQPSYEEPVFTVAKNAAEFPLESGRPKLVGVHRLPGAPEQIELFMMTVTGAPGSGRTEQPRQWSGQVEVQMVAVPMPAAVRLLPKLRRPETFRAAEVEVQALLATGEAELLGWPITQGYSRGIGRRSGEDGASSATSREILFPSEFDQPQIPQIIGVSEYPPRPPTLAGMFPVSEMKSAKAFELRETGPYLEAFTGVDAKGNLRVALKASFVQSEALELAIGARSIVLGERFIEQPRFSSFAVETRLTIPNDGRLLLDSFVEKRPSPRMVLFLLHAIAQPAAAPLYP